MTFPNFRPRRQRIRALDVLMCYPKVTAVTADALTPQEKIMQEATPSGRPRYGSR